MNMTKDNHHLLKTPQLVVSMSIVHGVSAKKQRTQLLRTSTDCPERERMADAERRRSDYCRFVDWQRSSIISNILNF